MMLPVPPIRLRPSRRALRWIGGLYLAAAVISLSLPWPAPARLALMSLVLVDGWLSRRRLNRCYGVKALRVTADHRLQIETHQEPVWVDIQPRPDCFLWPIFVVLHIKRPDARRGERWLLLPDMMSAEEWRSLRVWVRWKLPELMPKREEFWSGLKSRFRRRGG